MAKKRKATPDYLIEVEQQFIDAKAELQKAKGELYLSSIDAKLFDLNFEEARQRAIKATDVVNSLYKEITRVMEALQDPEPELFGDN